LKTLKIALAQLDFAVGAIGENTSKILAAIAAARELGASLAIFPELAITGYPPEDLLFKPDFIAQNLAALRAIAAETRQIAAIVGFVDREGDIFNAAALLAEGEIKAVYRKRALPNYGVFDEERYFARGSRSLVFEACGAKFAVLICEDLWDNRVLAQIDAADALITINASPFSAAKTAARRELIASRARDLRSFLIYANLVGAQDELVFAGESGIANPRGECVARAKSFAEDLLIAEIDLEESFRARLKDARARSAGKDSDPLIARDQIKLNLNFSETPAALNRIEAVPDEIAAIYEALKLGLKDYAAKNGFTSAVLGLSGGIDSALTAAIASDALGAENVLGVLMPSKFSSRGSIDDSLALAANLKIRAETIAINDLANAYDRALAPLFTGTQAGLAEENLQARIRAAILMAISNKFGHLLLSTGNKSEIAVGYATLYGDMAGGFAPIKDALKTMVYDLARYRNSLGAAIPEATLTKPPSAELREGQKDSDELPEYEVLDPIIKLLVEEDYSTNEVAAMGYDLEIAEKVARMIKRNEYKRSQAAIGTKISDRAFGRDRRMPITSKAK
jgi:NAD+ synthase (glutamine-hydrolysing)